MDNRPALLVAHHNLYQCLIRLCPLLAPRTGGHIISRERVPPNPQMKRKFCLTPLLPLILLTTTAQSRAQTDWSQPKSAYEATKAALAPHFDGFSIDGAPQAPGLLDHEWILIGEWLARYLTEHPSASTDEIKAVVGRLDSTLEVGAIELDEHTYVVTTRQDEMGNIILLARMVKNLKRIEKA